MASLAGDRATKGTTQMGGEGIQWVGAAPFVTMEHRFQNIGDGTYHHSGSLALRQAVAAGTNITYKILYNGAVAMTGGQDIDGQMTVPELTRSIQAEGVTRILVVTDDTEKYPPSASFAPDVDIWHRSRLDEAQRVLRDTPGCTVLIYDQACAAELRRDRKRGKVADPQMRIFINEAVCEGCGDCGVKSSCMSVQPVETEFGRKTQIHQSSCNKDYSCLAGDCPAFVEVIPDPNAVKKATVAFEAIGPDLPEPAGRIDEGDVLMMGIGGTGVVTVNQLLATAALLDGKQAHGLDQTGLSQKGGSVISNLKIRRVGDGAGVGDGADGRALGIANKVASGEADAYLVFDMLTGVSAVNLEKASPERTVAVVSSSKVPTGAMVRDVRAAFPPEWAAIQATIETVTRPGRNVYLDAGTVSDNLFRSHEPANVIVLGAAYQQGVIPISAQAIERAIELNGVSVATNTQAFRVGRKIALDPGLAGGPGAGAGRLGPPFPGPPVEEGGGHGRRRAPAVGRAGPPARRAGGRADRLPGHGLRPALRGQGGPGPAGRAGGGGRHPAVGGGGPLPVQADGLQGRVRGGPPPPVPGVQGGPGRTVRGGGHHHLQAPPAHPAPGGGRRQDRPGPQRRGGLCRPGPHEEAPGHLRRPVRPHPPPAHGAGADRGVRGPARQGDDRAVARHLRPGGGGG